MTPQDRLLASTQSSATTTVVGATSLNGHAWRDGERPPDDAFILDDRGFVLGDGIFETIAVRRGGPVLFRAHVQRLQRTADALGFSLPADLEARIEHALHTLRGLADPKAGERGALRITITRGAGTAYGLDVPVDPEPTFMVRLTVAKIRPRTLAGRETAWVVDQPRIDPSGALAGHKTTSSMWRVLAHERARERGADLALLRTIEGDIGEADSASVFAVIDGVAVTPPLSRGILPGTTRAFALDRLRDAGASHAERILRPVDLEAATEVFVTSSVNGIRPLAAVDGQPLPAATPVCDRLHEDYEKLSSG